MQWEYWSRLNSLALKIVGRRPFRVLDLGCGYGTLAMALAAAAGIEVVGVDILRDRLLTVAAKWKSRASHGKGNLQLVVANADRGLPFRGETFDIVVATELLEHLDNPERALAEIRRVLRGDGRLYVTTPNSAALPYRLLNVLPKPLVRGLARLFTQETLHPGLLSCTPTHPDHHRREGFTLAELQSLGQRCSLALVEGHTYRIPLPDRLLGLAPRSLAWLLAAWGSEPIPLGLEVFGEFERVGAVT